MSLKMKAKAGGGDFEHPEPGNQPAVLVAVIDLGTVLKTFKDEEYEAHELYFCWELTDQQMTGSTYNHVIGRSYTASIGKKSNLGGMIGKWRGRPIADGEEFDPAVLLGKACLLDVQATPDGKYTKLDPFCASSLPKSVPSPAAKRKPVVWEIEDNDKLPEHLDWLPYLYGESIQDRIERSKEWRAKRKAILPDKSAQMEEYASAGADEIPF